MVNWNGRNARVRVNAEYKKRPLGTPGAYEVVDEESGEKVIVWGGVDEGDDDWNPNNLDKKAPRTGGGTHF